MSFIIGSPKKKKPFDKYDDTSLKSKVSISSTNGTNDPTATASLTEAQAEEVLHGASSSLLRFYPRCCEGCSCCSRDLNKISRGYFGIIKDGLFYCPPTGPIPRIIIMLLFVCLPTAIMYLVAGPIAGFCGPIFAFTLIEIIGITLAIFFKFLRLPALLGPLCLGIVWKNGYESLDIFRNFESPHYNCTVPSDLHLRAKIANRWIKPIRQIALSIILTRAGIELSPKKLAKLSYMVPCLAFIPCIVEAFTCTAIIYSLFHMNLALCFVAGFSLAAVSPAVVVPGMLNLNSKGYGVERGIPTLLIAASSIDDVLAISIFTVALNFAVPHNDVTTAEQVAHYGGGPISILIGIAYGTLVGCLLHILPPRDMKNLAEFRTISLLMVNITAALAFDMSDWTEGAATVGVLVTSFIASFGWRSQARWKKPMKRMEKVLAVIWTMVVPLLFGTIGIEMNFSRDAYKLENISKILLIIFTCLITRITAAFSVFCLKKFTWKERIFGALSWIPKATVQAALAPLALSTMIAEEVGNDPTSQREKIKNIQDAEIVLTMAVLAIIITAPLGSILISLLGTKLLTKVDPETKMALEDKEFPNGDPDLEEFNHAINELTNLMRTKSMAIEAEHAEGTQSQMDNELSSVDLGSKMETPTPNIENEKRDSTTA